MSKDWTTALGVKPKQAQKLKEKAPQGECSLNFAFNQDYLKFEKYKTWAMKKLEIPFLSPKALKDPQSLEAIQNFCAQQKITSAGGHDYINFYKYENIKYVACLWPPLGQAHAKPKNQTSNVFVFVLVSPLTMATLKSFCRSAHLKSLANKDSQNQTTPVQSSKSSNQQQTKTKMPQPPAPRRKKAS